MPSRPVRLVKALAILAWIFGVGLLASVSEGFIPDTPRNLLIAALILGPLLVFGEAILEFLLQVVAYTVGRTLLPVVSLGLVRGETMNESLTFPWHGVTRSSTGQLVMSADATSLFGLVVLGLVSASVIYAFL